MTAYVQVQMICMLTHRRFKRALLEIPTSYLYSALYYSPLFYLSVRILNVKFILHIAPSKMVKKKKVVSMHAHYFVQSLNLLLTMK